MRSISLFINYIDRFCSGHFRGASHARRVSLSAYPPIGIDITDERKVANAAGNVNWCVNDKETTMPCAELRSACAGNQSAIARCCSCKVAVVHDQCWESGTAPLSLPTSARRRHRQACGFCSAALRCSASCPVNPATSQKWKVNAVATATENLLNVGSVRPVRRSHALWNTMLEAAGKQRAHGAQGRVERKKRGCQWRG